MTIQFKRNTATHVTTPLADGEPGWTTDTHELYVGQGGTNYLINSAGGGGAPANADYLVKTPNGTLTAERVVIDTGFIAADWTAAGVVGFNIVGGSITTTQLGGDITAAGKALLDDANAAAQRTTLGLGSVATLASDTDATLAANSNANIPTQAAVKSYVDNLVTGLNWKHSVRAATAANAALATAYENGDTVDGVTLATGDRILLKNQTTGSENGIYTVNASGAPTRATDADTGLELVNATVLVEDGTANADTQWTCTNNQTPTLGTTAIVFAQISGAGTYTASGGVVLTGNVFSADFGTIAGKVTQGNDARLSDSRAPNGAAGGDLAGTYPGPTIAADAVTYAKLQNVSATARILGRKTAGAGDPEECTLSDVLDFIGSANRGDMLFRGATTWTKLTPGTAGSVLQSQGAPADLVWGTLAIPPQPFARVFSGPTTGAAGTGTFTIPTTFTMLRISGSAPGGGGGAGRVGAAATIRDGGNGGNGGNWADMTFTLADLGLTQTGGNYTLWYSIEAPGAGAPSVGTAAGNGTGGGTGGDIVIRKDSSTGDILLRIRGGFGGVGGGSVAANPANTINVLGQERGGLGGSSSTGGPTANSDTYYAPGGGQCGSTLTAGNAVVTQGTFNAPLFGDPSASLMVLGGKGGVGGSTAAINGLVGADPGGGGGGGGATLTGTAGGAGNRGGIGRVSFQYW
jgi:hypothetical protein